MKEKYVLTKKEMRDGYFWFICLSNSMSCPTKNHTDTRAHVYILTHALRYKIPELNGHKWTKERWRKRTVLCFVLFCSALQEFFNHNARFRRSNFNDAVFNQKIRIKTKQNQNLMPPSFILNVRNKIGSNTFFRVHCCWVLEVEIE